MDGSAFDQWSRAFVTSGSRRSLLGLLSGFSVAGLVVRASDVAARPGRKAHRHHAQHQHRHAKTQRRKHQHDDAHSEACIPTGQRCPARKVRGKRARKLGCDHCCQGSFITEASGKTVCGCQPNGGACTSATAAACCSGFCTGATCQAAPCSEAHPCPPCQTCNATTGLCEAVADGTACDDGDACTTDDSCQGGACQSGGPVGCAEGQRCAAGSCVCDATSCPSGCCADTTCLPVSAQSPSQCGTGVPGAACVSCAGSGASCGGGGTPGQCGCTPLATCPAPLDCGQVADGCGGLVSCGPETCPPAADPCQVTTCQANRCTSGAGHEGADCGSASCAAGMFTPQGACSGGTCQSGSPVACAPYTRCDGDACATRCDDDDDCVGTSYCTAAHQCVGDQDNGQPCAHGGQCQTGFCTDGVCCASAGCDQCQACNRPGQAGTCQPQANGTACDDGDPCTTVDTCQSGICQSGPAVVCPSGQRCVGGACVCDDTSCATGCCAGGTCHIDDDLACGTGGGSCITCTGPGVTCGGGGTPGVCGCTATTCVPLHFPCGTIDNGCGGTIDCGPCCVSDLQSCCFGAGCLRCCPLDDFCIFGLCQ